MKKLIGLLIILALLIPAAVGVYSESAYALPDPDGFAQTLSDWIIGSGWGIQSGEIDIASQSVTLTLPEDRLQALTDTDRQDILTAVGDILALYLSPTGAAEGFTVLYTAGGPESAVIPPVDNTSAQPGTARANLMFIHHSVGENWLRDGLCEALNAHGYHVADIYYGWREYGDRTDTSDWPMWFTDTVMDLVYREMGAMTAPNTIEPAQGDNTIIMFKSCFPNSDVGNAITDEQAVYNSLLSYTAKHPDKLFILVTPPPMTHISHPLRTRELSNWLTDREGGWLQAYPADNVRVFDLYNVLTHPDAHHLMENGAEIHTVIKNANTLYYDSDGDDHPNSTGNNKAAREFIGLLDAWYTEFVAE